MKKFDNWNNGDILEIEITPGIHKEATLLAKSPEGADIVYQLNTGKLVRLSQILYHNIKNVTLEQQRLQKLVETWNESDNTLTK